MTTKNEASITGDAQTPDLRPTKPGLGAEFEEAQAVPSSKQFDPRRYQANTVPTGLQSVVICTELPSMPRSRIEDTLPPTDAADFHGEPAATRVLAGSSRPQTVQEPVEAREKARPPRVIPFRLAIALAVAMFVAGALMVFLVLRGTDGGERVAVPSAPTAAVAPTAAAEPTAAVLKARTVAVAPTAAVVADPATPRSVASPKTPPDPVSATTGSRIEEPSGPKAARPRNVVAAPKSAAAVGLSRGVEPKPRVRNEEPE